MVGRGVSRVPRVNLSDPLGATTAADIMAFFKLLFFLVVDFLGLCRGYNYGKTRAVKIGLMNQVYVLLL